MIARAAIVGVALLALQAAAGTARGDGAPGDSTEVAARARFQSGLALFKAGLFEAAEQEFELGYSMKPLPLFLFNAAQAARRANQPVTALALYRKFVTLDIETPQRAEALERIAELEQVVKSLPPPSPPGVARPAASPIAVARPAARRWYLDPAGGALLGVGAAASLAGVVVLGVGGARVLDAERSYGSFDAAHQATPLLIAGGVTLGLGVALLAVAVVRYALVRRDLRGRRSLGAGAGFTTAGLGFQF
jgi:hypothetical protein